MVRRIGWQAVTARQVALPVSVSVDHAGVDREALATDQTFCHAAPNRRLEHLKQEIAVAEATVTVLREGRVIGHGATNAQPTSRTADLPNVRDGSRSCHPTYLCAEMRA